MKRTKIVIMTLFLIFCLSGCSETTPEEMFAGMETVHQDEGMEVIYSTEGMAIYRVETEYGKELWADMSIVPAQLSEDAKEFLVTGESASTYGVPVFKGTEYQGMENVYVYTYGALSDIADSLHLDILASDLSVYPESEKNFTLKYTDDTQNRTISIEEAYPKFDKDYYISYMNIYLCFGPEKDRGRCSLENITDEADYIKYEIAEGEQAYILYDLSLENATVFVWMDGAFYEWNLAGVNDMDDLYDFADSIHWVTSSD